MSVRQLPAMPLICDCTRESFVRPITKHPDGAFLSESPCGRVASNPLPLVCRYQHHRPDACAARSACEAKYTSHPTSSLALVLPSRSLCSLHSLHPSLLKHYKHKGEKHGHRHQQRPCLCAARHRARSTPPVQWQCQSQQLVPPRSRCLRLPQYALLMIPNGNVYTLS